jgi:HlyD family secretion protein
MGMSKKKRLVIWVSVIVVLVAAVTISIVTTRKDAPEVSIYKVEKRKLLQQIVSASGEVRPIQFINLTSDVQGRIEEIYVKEGDAVKKGAPLVKIDPSQFESSKDAQSAALEAALFDSRSARSQISEAEQNLSTQITATNTARLQLGPAEIELNDAKRKLREETELLESGVSTKSSFEDAKVRVRLAEDNLAIRRSNVEEAEQRVKAQRLIVERLKIVASSSEKRAEQQAAVLRGQQTQKDKTIPTAPINGVIADIPSKVGTFATAGLSTTPLLTIADMSSINIEVKIDETEIDKVVEGQTAIIKVDAFDQIELKGRVSQKTPLALGKSQTTGGLSTNINIQEAKEFKVVIELLEIPEAVREGLRPGMSATAEITTATVENVIAVPLQSLVRKRATDSSDASAATTGGVPKKPIEGVYVIDGENAKFIAVKTGINGEFDIEIKSGLKEGLEVITGPNKALSELSDGSKVKKEKTKTAAKK